MIKVLVFGTFDLIHPGHVDFLNQAKEYGDELIVVVARDITVKSVKKELPHNDENMRLKEVAKIKTVSKALLGNTDDPYRIIESIKPDIICLGYDQNHFAVDLAQVLKERNLSIRIVRLMPYKETEFKSSIIKNNNAKDDKL